MNQPFEATCSDLENFIHVLSTKNVKVTFSNKNDVKQKLDHRPVIIIIKLSNLKNGHVLVISDSP